MGKFKAMTMPQTENPGQTHNRARGSKASSVGGYLMVALVVLALVASVIMLVTDSHAALKLALVAALWAAVLGSFLTFRYRKQAEAADTRLAEEMRVLHERAEVQSQALALHEANPLGPEMEILQEIRAQIEELRAQLEELAGFAYEYEPAVLRAEARRLQEIEARTAALGEPEHQARPGDLPGAPSFSAVSGNLGRNADAPRAGISPELAQVLQEVEPTEPEPVATAVPVRESHRAAHRAPEEESTGGRRRADEREGAVSVTELMKRLQERRS